MTIKLFTLSEGKTRKVEGIGVNETYIYTGANQIDTEYIAQVWNFDKGEYSVSVYFGSENLMIAGGLETSEEAFERATRVIESHHQGLIDERKRVRN